MANNDSSKEGKPIPRIPVEVVTFLDQTYPERCADLKETLSEIYYRAGQRSVVTYLIRLLEEQNENVL
jgi:hypothetical protein